MYELIIIDNGSTITEEDCTERARDSVGKDKEEHLSMDFTPDEYWGKADVLIKNETNLGFAPACNQGFNKASGKYICCLNNDVLVLEDWLNDIFETFEIISKMYDEKIIDKKPGVIMPALLHDLRDAVKAISIKKKDVNLNTNREKYGAGAEFGSLWVAPRQLLLDIAKRRDGCQVFDENFKLGMGEDRWLWQEVRLEGYETYRTHRTRVFHQGNLTIGKVKDRKVYTTKNREYLAELKKLHGIIT